MPITLKPVVAWARLPWTRVGGLDVFAERTSRTLPALLFGLVLLLAACNGEGTTPADEGDTEASAGLDGPITLYDAQWESLWVNNAIFQLIVEEGYGHEVRIAEVSTPIMQQSLLDGEVHVAIEMWCINYQEWCDQHEDAENIGVPGTIFSEAEQGWYVPRYVIEGDEDRGIEPSAPGLGSVFDLAEHVDVFDDPNDPGNGLIITGITGWEVTELSETKVYAYGLDDRYNTQQAGSGAALDAAIAGAYARGDPIVFYYWAPSWIHAEFDLVLLEEPGWTPECQEAMETAAEADPATATEEAGCAFAGGDVEIGIWPGLSDAAPDVVALLERMHVGDDPMNEVLAYMELEDAEPEDAALWYFQEYADDWRGWIDDDEAVQRVEEALRDRGVDV
jgi:glycine betaine/proline transport system substrate-binding protein